jgi:SAM-dependent methyltransferase
VPPRTYAELADEIEACTDLDRATVEAKLWQQAIGPGNVQLDAARFGITPHRYDAAMERLYRESDAFIFETLLYAQRPYRRAWNVAAWERIERHAQRSGVPVAALRILLFGDGCGEDSLYLAARGCRVEYFDLPGSRTFAFATQRFARHGVLGSGVTVRSDFSALENASYDVVISFEVLEHLTDPHEAMATMAGLLKLGGIALISEAFDTMSEGFPTHLATGFALRDTTRFLFLRHGLVYRWTNRTLPDKPMEYERRNLSYLARVWTMLRVRSILRAWLLLIRRGRMREASLGYARPLTTPKQERT